MSWRPATHSAASTPTRCCDTWPTAGARCGRASRCGTSSSTTSSICPVRVGIYDLEFAHLFGRRHYDVARLYATLAVPFDAAAGAAELLGSYLAASCLPVDAVAPACLPVLTEALLAQLYDAAREESPVRQHRACERLARCLTGDLRTLLVP